MTREVEKEEKKKEIEEKVITKLKKTKVAIVGCADSRNLAPWDDDSFEIWGVNNLYSMIPRADRWFEIHQITSDGKNLLRRGDINFRGQRVGEYLTQLGKWAEKQNCPVYMQQKWEAVPTATTYPLKEILKEFGGYFTNSISYQIALAIYEGFEEIHVYGVDMAVDSEYHHQRPSCEYFLGLATGRGIKVYIPAEADLMKTRFLYGFHETEQTAWDKKIKMMTDKMTNKRLQCERTIQEQTAKMHQYIGAGMAAKECKKIWG